MSKSRQINSDELYDILLNRFCCKCNSALTKDNVWLARIKKNHFICKSCSYIENKKWSVKNKDKTYRYGRNWIASLNDEENKARLKRNAKRSREHYAEMRLQIIEHYGNQCRCCGEKYLELLTIEHKLGDGYKDRRENGGLRQMYRKIIREGYPDTYEILCMNCNASLGHYDYCPHDGMGLDISTIDFSRRKKIVSKNDGICRICRNKPASNKDFKLKMCDDCFRICYNQYRLKTRLKRKIQIYKAYGNKCECCGISTFEFLTFEHKNGDGQEKRPGSQVTFYKWIIDNNYPDSIGLLCWNCNLSLGVNGYCPHRPDFKANYKPRKMVQ